MLKVNGNKIVYTFDAETLWVEPWGRDAVRVRATMEKEMPEKDWALLPQEETDASAELLEDRAVLTNGKITAIVDMRGKITFFNQRGERLLEEYVRQLRSNVIAPGKPAYNFGSALNTVAREFLALEAGNYKLTARFESDPNEKLYGIGEYQQPFLNVKGCEMNLGPDNSQACVPFAVSSLGYGFLWHNPAFGKVVLGRNLTYWTADVTDLLDYWITAGDTPADITENYARATGTVPMMPDWATGFWQCKLRYQTQDELMHVAREYKRRGIPISVIVIDYFHWTKQGEWKFDPKYWPDPQGMVDELKSMGIELMVSIWPTVDHTSENFREMQEKGYLMRSRRGQRISSTLFGNTILTDLTNADARAFLWNKVREHYYKYGIRVFWLDAAAVGYHPGTNDLFQLYEGPVQQVGNLYPMMYSRTFYDGMTGEGQKNVINLVGSAWAGSQRYGAVVWSGDIESSFRSLRMQFAAGLNMGLAGIPWWTTDIGGFFYGCPDDPAFRECFTRWFEYGTFCPVMRLHGDRDPHTKPLGTSGGGICGSGAPNEVWSYGPEVEKICIEYINLRERMRPYVTRLMAQAHEKGTPVIRTLFYEFPKDSKAWEIEDAYMFGDELLVAPILGAGVRSRMVYLPEGAKWTNVWTGESFCGGNVIRADAPIERIPVFARDDSELLKLF